MKSSLYMMLWGYAFLAASVAWEILGQRDLALTMFVLGGVYFAASRILEAFDK